MIRGVVLFFILIFSSHLLMAQRVVTGRVTDEQGEPLIGVTVLNKETQTGSITDIEGNYRVTVEDGQTLAFSFVSMKPQEVLIQGQSVLDILLEVESEVLGEVVVTGFQEVSRKLFTGAADRVDMEKIKVNSIADVSRVLEGQVAGVNVDNVSGTFGTSPRIRIRGNTSINGNNQPLIVVDGVILEDLSNVNTEDLISGNANTLISSSIANLNPSDIATFEILKDASATAIYGARAANGVIVVTTKRGKSGQLRVNYTGTFSGKLRPTYNQFNLLNSAEEMSVYRELFEKGIIDITTSVRSSNYGAMGKMFALIANHDLEWGPGGTLNEEFLNRYENANTDWFDVLFRDFGLQQQHALSFTAGSDKNNSYYSISYLNDQGQTIADEVQRITASSRNTYYISDKFSFGLKTSASYRDQRVPGTRNREFDPITGRFSRGFDINPYSYALNTARSISPIDEEGNREYFRRNYTDFNILDELDYNFIDISVVDLSAQTDFEVNPFKKFNIRGVFQARFANTTRDHTVNENSNQAEAYRANDTQFIQDANNLLFRDPDNPGLNPVVVLPQGGFNYVDKTDLLNIFSRVSADWSHTLNDDHEFNTLFGQEIRFTNRSESTVSGLGVIYESGGIVVTDPNIIEFFNQQDIDYYRLSESKDRFIGWFLNGGYAFRQKYIANFTVRYDGSNQLGKSQQARFLPTWNVSGAWNIINESFMDRFTFLDDLKLRTTYGISGNLPPGASAILNIQSDVTVRPTDVEPYLFIQDLTNTELTWEKLKEFNVGMDFSFLQGKVNGSFNYFIRNAFDLIGTVQTSGIGGQGLKVGNFADMESDGYEVTLNTSNISGENFQWSSSLNIGYITDRITKLDFGPRFVDAIGQGGAAVLNGPRRGLYSTKYNGLSSIGIPTFIDGDGDVTFQYDLQERENLRDFLQYEGPIEPRGAGGFTNTFSYRGFSLNVLLSYKFDYKIRLNDALQYTYTDFQALPGELADRWVVPGDEEITDVPVILDPNFIVGTTTVPNAEGGELGAIVNRQEAIQSYQLYNKSTVRVADGDYVRLKTVRLSYRFPERITGPLGFSSGTFSIEGQNLGLLYSDRKKLKGQDPEFFSSGGVALPQPRIITFSISIGI